MRDQGIDEVHQEAVSKTTRFRSKTRIHMHFGKDFCSSSLPGLHLQGLPCKQRDTGALTHSFPSNKARNTGGGSSANITKFKVSMQSASTQQAVFIHVGL